MASPRASTEGHRGSWTSRLASKMKRRSHYEDDDEVSIGREASVTPERKTASRRVTPPAAGGQTRDVWTQISSKPRVNDDSSTVPAEIRRKEVPSRDGEYSQASNETSRLHDGGASRDYTGPAYDASKSYNAPASHDYAVGDMSAIGTVQPLGSSRLNMDIPDSSLGFDANDASNTSGRASNALRTHDGSGANGYASGATQTRQSTGISQTSPRSTSSALQSGSTIRPVDNNATIDRSAAADSSARGITGGTTNGRSFPLGSSNATGLEAGMNNMHLNNAGADTSTTHRPISGRVSPAGSFKSAHDGYYNTGPVHDITGECDNIKEMTHPTAEEIIAKSKYNSAQTTIHERQASAVTHNTIIKEVTEIKQEAITRDIHNYHYVRRLLPVHDVEILPAKHYRDAGHGVLVEMLPEEIPQSRIDAWESHILPKVEASRQQAMPGFSRGDSYQMMGVRA